MAEPLLEEAERGSEARQAGAKVRVVGEGAYRAGSWDRARRVVMKAEVLEKGTNTRFVVPSKKDEPPIRSSTIGTRSVARPRGG